jgi:thymidine kinase
MAKLFFRYSTMNAGKSIDLIKTNFNYFENDRKTLCFTSAKDNRYGEGKITSRIGLSVDAISVFDDTNIFDVVYKYIINNEQIYCVFVDESQFLNKNQVFQLADIVDGLDIPVICYGLRTDFVMEMFEGSKYLMAIADSIEEIKTICFECKTKKAIINARITDGKIVTEGDQVMIGGNDTYKPLCRKCYKKLKNV